MPSLPRTWIAVALCVFFVAGCEGGLPTGNSQASTSRGGAAALKDTRPRLPEPLDQVALAGGEVVVTGPQGYCIDPTTVRKRATRGFAMLAACQILSGGEKGGWAEPVLMTVTVGPRGASGDLPSAADLASAAGAGLAGEQVEPGFVAANLDAGGTAFLSGGDDRHWRGAFVQSGHLIGLALYAPKGSRLAGPAGGTLLGRLQDAIEKASGGADPTVAPAARNPAGKPARKPGLMGRILSGLGA